MKELQSPVTLQDLAQNKIFVDIQPVDDWKSWAYKIYLEDAMSPFFEAYSNGYEKHFVSHYWAFRDAIDWLEQNGHINIVELPF